MMYKNRKYKWLSLVLALVMVILPFNIIDAASEIIVNIAKEDPVIFLSNEGERVFDIGYEFDVSYEAITSGVDVVLVLDRSNSMLRLDPSTDLPVADAVWDAVNTFVTEVYATYPETNVAIVSFGSNANKSDNWKYYDNLADTLNEIEVVFDYRDLYSSYHSNFRSYWNNGYRYAWENWRISDGATNISAAFEYGSKTTEMKETVTKDNDHDVLILFTDGVATQGGSNSQRNYNYPTSHNTNTIAAYESGIEAQTNAEIITVGYFEGIEYESTKTIARETLELANNAGMFEAAETSQLSSIFDTIIDELNFIGTDAVVTETIEDEFEVVTASIQPDDYEMTTDAEGRTVISWPLGNVVDSGYAFGYQVQVKDDVYPTGSGTVKIPINLDATLTYTDLQGNEVIELLGHNEVTIPPRGNQPLVEVDALYEDNIFGYLVGDDINIIHDMSFENEAPFDYRNIQVADLTKTIEGGNFGTRIVLDQTSIDAGWSLQGDDLVYNINDEKAVTGDDNLVWTHQVPLTLTPLQVGNYTLASNVDYTLTNSVDIAFDFANSKLDPQPIGVREGLLKVTFVDQDNQPIYNIPLKINDAYVLPYVYNGIHEYKGVTTGTHSVEFQVPSGYWLDDTNPSYEIDADGYVSFNFGANYDTPEFSKLFVFEALDVKDIVVSDRAGNDYTSLMQLAETNEAMVKFTVVNDLTVLKLNLVDDYAIGNHVFEIEAKDGDLWVEDSNGLQIEGFSMNGNVIEYSGGTLLADDYTVYGLITTPENFGDDQDFDFYVDVDEITTRQVGDIVDDIRTTTSIGLTLDINDVDPPVADATLVLEKSTSNSGHNILVVTDMIQISELIIYGGILELEDINEESVIIKHKPIKDLGNEITAEVDVPLEVVLVGNRFASIGYASVYVKDVLGNEAVYLLTVDSNTEYTNLQ